MSKKSNLYKFAERELEINIEDPDMRSHILKIVELFAEEGHSGFSANYAVNILSKVLRYEPLSPLTGNDDEWVHLEYECDVEYQNKRCHHVFKRKDGTAYDSEFYIFQDSDGICYTNFESRKDITFPYTPRKEYIRKD